MQIYLVRESLNNFRIGFVTDYDGVLIYDVMPYALRHYRTLVELYDSFTEVDNHKYEVLCFHPCGAIPLRVQCLPTLKCYDQGMPVSLYVVRLLALIDITEDDIDEYLHKWEVNAPDEFWYWPNFFYKPIVERIALDRLREVAPSIMDETDFIMFESRDWLARGFVTEELRRRGTMIINYKKPYWSFGYVAMVCQKPPNHIAQSILQRMNGWGAMMVELGLDSG